MQNSSIDVGLGERMGGDHSENHDGGAREALSESSLVSGWKSETADLAVIVIGRNEGQRLIDCLVSLGAGVRRAVYVDSGSTDGSAEAAERLGAHVLRLDLSTAFTAARARNAGFREAMRCWRGLRFVQFVDGDCTVQADWMENGRGFLESRPDVAIVYGRRSERFPDRSIFNRLCDHEWDGPAGQVPECGGDILVRVDAFQAAGGYCDGLIAGEEPELCVRLRESGWAIHRLRLAMTRHDANILTVRQWWLRTVRAGHAFAEVALLHRNSSCGIWKRNVLRAGFWGGLLPCVALGLSFHNPLAAFCCLLLYPLQIVRLALRGGPRRSGAWAEALLFMAGKFAEMQGALTFFAGRLTGRHRAIIEYKMA